MTTRRNLTGALGLVTVVGLASAGAVIGQNAPPAPAAAKPAPDEAAVRALSEGFVAAYNKRDADGVAALFTEDARVVEDDGTVVEGRPAIRERFLDTFAGPDVPKLRLEIVSLRFPASGVAVEDGVLIAEGEEGRRGPFSALHVLKDGHWLTAEVRDRAEAPGSPDEGTAALAALNWLIGEWVDESEEGVVRTSCKRSDDGHYLLREYEFKHRDALLSKGVQRIGWDPVRKQVRSWVFDSEGGFNEGYWTRVAPDQWVIRSSGYLREGDHVAATNTLTRVGPDAFRWGSADRVIGDTFLDDFEEVLIVRRPPPPN